MSSQHADIQSAIDSLDVDQARSLLREALKEPDADTYFLASQVALYDEQHRDFLQKAVDLDPFHKKAFDALKHLDAPAPVKVAEPQPSPAPVAASPAPAPVQVYQPLNKPQQPRDNRMLQQEIDDLERKIGRLENEIMYIDQGLSKSKNNKIAAAVLMVVGLFLVVALIGLVILIAAAVMYNNAVKEEKQLTEDRFKRQNELTDARQKLSRLQRVA